MEDFGFQALLAYRLGRWLRSVRRRPVYWPVMALLYPIYALLTIWVRAAYGIHLDQNADIGPGFYIGHFGGIRVIRCKIGSNCSIHQHVSLCPKDNDGSGNGPVVGRYVWIGAHARVHGNIRIGDGATIGAGALVKLDVPEGSLVLGNPGRVMQRGFDNSAML
jgi:serine O-acetyltransferase